MISAPKLPRRLLSLALLGGAALLSSPALAESDTPIPPSLTPSPFYTPTPALPTVIPGTIGVGGMVEVTEDGLRLRDSPSLSGKILSQASAHELFKIVDGPRQSDGYTWWLLQGVYDATRQGWAVETYLKPS